MTRQSRATAYLTGNGHQMLSFDSYRSVAVWHTGQLGDTIVALPAMRAVRAVFPRARLWLVIDADSNRPGAAAAEILARTGLFSGTVVYDPGSLRNRRGRREFAEAIRSLGPEAVVYLARVERSRRSIWRDWFFFRTLGIKHLFGFRPGKPFSWKRAAKRGPLPKQVDRLLDKLRLDGLSVPNGVRFDVPIVDEDIRLVDELWSEWRLAGRGGPVVAVCAGSKMPAKRWPEERYAELGKRLREELGCFLVAIGGPKERELAERLVAAWGGGSVACWRGGYLAMAELLGRCDLYLGNDTGPMHLAAAAGTRCVGIFSARDPAGTWAPYGEGHLVLRRRVPCEFCKLEECSRPGHPCLTGIEVEEAFEACRRVLVPG